MPKSVRSASTIAGLVIWFFTCSQILVFTAPVHCEIDNTKPESSNKTSSVSKKSTKKRKKKKRVATLPYFGVRLPVDTPAPRQQSASSVLVPVPRTRATTHASRTPGLHFTPVKASVPAAQSFSGTSGGIIIDSLNPDPDPLPAVPYSSDIEVSGLVGIITSVSVSINRLQHNSPDDLDMLLVAPNGRSFHFWSDVGGGSLSPPPEIPIVTVTVSDLGTDFLPDHAPLVDGTTYKPFNNDTEGDVFPPPAPGPPYGEPNAAGGATFASVFGGMIGELSGGTWSLFVTDDQNFNGGSIDSWTLNITTEIPSTTAGQLVISEFRTNGPGGPNDEFVELYNTTAAPLVVQASDESSGLGVVASDGNLRCTVPNGTVIPTNGHYLCVNNSGAGSSPTISSSGPDATFTTDIPTDAGIAIFNSTSTFSFATRLDAVGSTAEANTLYKEGNGYPALGRTSTLDHCLYRDLRPNGQPKDTGNNESDFLFVDTSGEATQDGQQLGAPSPEGLTDPRTSNDSVFVGLIAPCVGATGQPNRLRDFSSDPGNNSTFGTLSIRRAVTNLTVNEITRLRFKVIDITTFPAQPGVADLRLRTSSQSVEADPCAEQPTDLNITGLTLEQPPLQPNGGGFNSNVVSDYVLQTPLQPGETIFVNFLLGVQQTGRFRFFVNIETLP